MTQFVEIPNADDSKIAVPNIEFESVKVVTTEILAQIFGCDVKNIQINFANNKFRFTHGKHYFELIGADLKDFKDQILELGYQVLIDKLKCVPKMILWTQYGVSLLSTILNNKNVREIAIELLNKYFDVSCNELFILEHSRIELDYADILIRFCNTLNLKVKSQVNIKKYRIDFVIEDKIFIEYDEKYHKNNCEKDKKRQDEITHFCKKTFNFTPVWIRLNQGYEIESLAQIALNLSLLK